MPRKGDKNIESLDSQNNQDINTNTNQIPQNDGDDRMVENDFNDPQQDILDEAQNEDSQLIQPTNTVNLKSDNKLSEMAGSLQGNAIMNNYADSESDSDDLEDEDDQEFFYEDQVLRDELDEEEIKVRDRLREQFKTGDYFMDEKGHVYKKGFLFNKEIDYEVDNIQDKFNLSTNTGSQRNVIEKGPKYEDEYINPNSDCRSMLVEAFIEGAGIKKNRSINDQPVTPSMFKDAIENQIKRYASRFTYFVDPKTNEILTGNQNVLEKNQQRRVVQRWTPNKELTYEQKVRKDRANGYLPYADTVFYNVEDIQIDTFNYLMGNGDPSKANVYLLRQDLLKQGKYHFDPQRVNEFKQKLLVTESDKTKAVFKHSSYKDIAIQSKRITNVLGPMIEMNLGMDMRDYLRMYKDARAAYLAAPWWKKFIHFFDFKAADDALFDAKNNLMKAYPENLIDAYARADSSTSEIALTYCELARRDVIDPKPGREIRNKMSKAIDEIAEERNAALELLKKFKKDNAQLIAQKDKKTLDDLRELSKDYENKARLTDIYISKVSEAKNSFDATKMDEETIAARQEAMYQKYLQTVNAHRGDVDPYLPKLIDEEKLIFENELNELAGNIIEEANQQLQEESQIIEQKVQNELDGISVPEVNEKQVEGVDKVSEKVQEIQLDVQNNQPVVNQ